VPLDRERQLRADDAAAVILDQDQALAAVAERHRDLARAGVERVLDQLLDRARRPLDDLARRNAVDDGLGQPADAHVAPPLVRM